MQVGFIGLGQMGAGMAANLLKAGYRLSVYNRSPDKAAPLAAAGAGIAASVAELASGSEIIVTMLADDAALAAVTDGPGGLLATMRPGSLHISCSTIGTATARTLAAAHATAGQRFVSAPVFGRPEAAAAARLFVVASGAAGAVADATPVLEAVGQRTFIVGEAPEAANLVKLSGNFLIASVIESLGEALALVEKGGVDPKAWLDLITGTLFNIPIYRNYGALITERQFDPPGFAAPLGQKDMRLVLAAGEELQVPLPLASLLRDRFLALRAQGGDGLDWSAIGRLPARDAGLA